MCSHLVGFQYRYTCVDAEILWVSILILRSVFAAFSICDRRDHVLVVRRFWRHAAPRVSY